MKAKKTPRRRTRVRAKTAKPKSHDDYLRGVDTKKRAALQKLRKAIQAAVPKAQECISYGIPSYRVDGKFLVAYGAGSNHCAFYPGSVLDGFKGEVKDYSTSKGTIRFPADKPLPSSLVRKLIKARLAQ
jgi:Uncharacterized conserved protein